MMITFYLYYFKLTKFAMVKSLHVLNVGNKIERCVLHWLHLSECSNTNTRPMQSHKMYVSRQSIVALVRKIMNDKNSYTAIAI